MNDIEQYHIVVHGNSDTKNPLIPIEMSLRMFMKSLSCDVSLYGERRKSIFSWSLKVFRNIWSLMETLSELRM